MGKILLISALMIMVFAFSCTSNTELEQKKAQLSDLQSELKQAAPQYIEITASELYESYKANSVRGDQLYKNQLIKVTGIVGSIGTEILGNPYVVLTNGGEYDIWGVQCIFPNTETYKNKLASFNKGDSIYVKGKCTGYLVNVMVEVQ